MTDPAPAAQRIPWLGLAAVLLGAFVSTLIWAAVELWPRRHPRRGARGASMKAPGSPRRRRLPRC